VLEDAYGELPVSHWVYPRDAADAPRSFARTPEILAFLERLYGRPYPWSKYAQVTIPGIGGGLEATTAIELGESTLHAARSHADFSSEWLVAHEAAHQWWGDLVSYRDWGETWLSESFATWSEYRWALHDLGPHEGALNLERKRRAYLEEARSRHRRPMVWAGWRFPDDNFDRHTYERGAVVIEMLADLLGEERWRRAMALFLERHAFEPVVTHDLVAAISDATAEDVTWFVEQWVMRPGHPELALDWEWDPAASELRVRVRQLQERKDGTPLYRLPLRFAFALGERREERAVWLEDEQAEWRFALPERPGFVVADPDSRLLAEWREEPGTGEWLARLRGAPAMARRRAAIALGAVADEPEVREALRGSAMEDPFSGVRAAAVDSLGPPRDAGETRWLTLHAAADPDGAVRAAALARLGEGAEPPLAFLVERAREEASDRARVEALRAAARAGAPPELFQEALGWRSGRDQVAAAAREILSSR
jgi:aminopeptidase N